MPMSLDAFDGLAVQEGGDSENMALVAPTT